MSAVFGAIVMRPPIAPSAGILPERCAGNGPQHGANEVLRRGVERIIVEKIEQLGNSGEALLAREHAGTRKIGSSALANLFRGIMGQDGQKRVDGFRGAQHGQSLDGPEARLQIRVARIAKKRVQYRGWFDAAIAECAESPQREIAALGIIVNLIEKFCEALRRRAREGHWSPEPQARDGKGDRCLPDGRARNPDSYGSS